LPGIQFRQNLVGNKPRVKSNATLNVPLADTAGLYV
jgi:hypothetical protein